jgi:hypothetical protein
VLLKTKQAQNEEINQLRERRQLVIHNNANDERRLREEERNAKEAVANARKNLE